MREKGKQVFRDSGNLFVFLHWIRFAVIRVIIIWESRREGEGEGEKKEREGKREHESK